MNASTFDGYIDVLLDACLNFQKGQNLQIQGEPIHWPVYNRVAEAAYRRGAKYVEVQAPTPDCSRPGRPPEAGYLDYLPDYLNTRVGELTADAWPRLAFVGSEDPDFFSTVDAQRNARVQKASRIVHKPLMEACASNKIPWVVAALPTPKWAARVLGCEPDGKACAALWDIMRPILRLDQPDPIAAWKNNSDALARRSATLNEIGFDAIHFQGPGTDLTLGLISGGQWAGGRARLPDGRHFIANIPTEENFTAPHWRRTTGRVRVTRPVEVLNKSVEGAWFVFADGRVTEFGADKGREQLEQYFSLDPQARCVGELALVDSGSPVFQSGKIFHTILYDENAACHIALGSAYPSVLKNADGLTSEQLSEAGVNQSLLHTDFMIGAPEVDVTGIAADGTRIPIQRKGGFTGPFV
ncbi:MAG: aminopeptidase [Kiritimatiellia bacterium]